MVSNVTGNPIGIIYNSNNDTLDYLVITAKDITKHASNDVGDLISPKILVYISAVDKVYMHDIATEKGDTKLGVFEHVSIKLLEAGKLIPTNIIKKYEEFDVSDVDMNSELAAADRMIESVIQQQQT
jgi:hypothetical protein